MASPAPGNTTRCSFPAFNIRLPAVSVLVTEPLLAAVRLGIRSRATVNTASPLVMASRTFQLGLLGGMFTRYTATSRAARVLLVARPP